MSVYSFLGGTAAAPCLIARLVWPRGGQPLVATPSRQHPVKTTSDRFGPRSDTSARLSPVTSLDSSATQA